MSEPILIHRCFDDFDEYCFNARAWNLDYRQIERGPFSGEMLLAAAEGMQFTRGRLGRRLVQLGAPPPDLRTFGLLAAPGITMYWRGKQVSGDQLFVFPEGGELDCVSQSDFDVFAVSLSEPTLAQVCHSLRLPEPQKLLNGREVFSCNPDDLHVLRQFFLRVERQLLAADTSLLKPRMFHDIAVEAADRLMTLISTGKYLRDIKPLRKRESALLKARDFVESHYAQHVSMSDLCRVGDASERTLEYAFRERYGVTPTYYVNTRRLNAAKKSLLLANPNENTVSEIALKMGFWHRSKFSEDYKRLFGELPSITLQRRIR